MGSARSARIASPNDRRDRPAQARPLTKGAANAADMTALVNASSNAETAKIAAKAATKATVEQAKCASGKCTDGTCEDCTAK